MATPRTVDRSKPLTCAHCCSSFMARRSGPLPKYCTPACKARAGDARATADGRKTVWDAHTSSRRAAAAEAHMAALLQHKAQCPTCGAVFSPGTARRVYCTGRCQMRAYNTRRQVDGRLAKYRAERRQRMREQADPSEVFRAADVYTRDAWQCWLCHEEIDHAALWPDPRSASVDHVVPLSRGGSHTLANVKAAHLRCNLVKGASLVAA